MDTTDLEAALTNTGRLVRGIAPDQWDTPTPCSEWNTRQLVNHTTWAMHMFESVHNGTAPRPGEDDLLGDDPAGSFDAQAARTVGAWKAVDPESMVTVGPGPMPAPMAMNINLLDTFTHGWDIATATGQAANLEEGLSARVLAGAQMLLNPEVRSFAGFDDAIEVAGGASSAEQLIAYLGRRP